MKFFKRFIDFFLSLIALIVLSPIFLILMLVGAIAMQGNPLFTQERLGRIIKKTDKERTFKLVKFRTMSNAKDEEGKLLPDGVRLNRYGKFLRSTSLDELPELWNIVRGDMAIVGPRPLLVSYLPYYTEVERHRHDVRPGLTGLAQVNGRNFIDWDHRLALDVKYVKEITFVGDIRIILQTAYKFIKKEDIAVDTNKVEPNFAEERRLKMKIR